MDIKQIAKCLFGIHVVSHIFCAHSYRLDYYRCRACKKIVWLEGWSKFLLEIRGKG